MLATNVPCLHLLVIHWIRWTIFPHGFRISYPTLRVWRVTSTLAGMESTKLCFHYLILKFLYYNSRISLAGDFTMDHGSTSFGPQSPKTWARRATCLLPCLPWTGKGPFANVLKACFTVKPINYVLRRHVLEDCRVIESVRKAEGIRRFLEECHGAGLSSASAYRYYISGLDSGGNSIPVMEHLKRGRSLMRMTDAWISIWEPRDWVSCDMFCDNTDIEFIFYYYWSQHDSLPE